MLAGPHTCPARDQRSFAVSPFLLGTQTHALHNSCDYGPVLDSVGQTGDTTPLRRP